MNGFLFTLSSLFLQYEIWVMVPPDPKTFFHAIMPCVQNFHKFCNFLWLPKKGIPDIFGLTFTLFNVIITNTLSLIINPWLYLIIKSIFADMQNFFSFTFTFFPSRFQFFSWNSVFVINAAINLKLHWLASIKPVKIWLFQKSHPPSPSSISIPQLFSYIAIILIDISNFQKKLHFSPQNIYPICKF